MSDGSRSPGQGTLLLGGAPVAEAPSPRAPHAFPRASTDKPSPRLGGDWWSSLRHGGLLISPSRLQQHFGRLPAPLPDGVVDRLRRSLNRLSADGDTGVGALIDAVLDGVCGFSSEPLSRWLKGADVGAEWVRKALTGENVKPRRVWRGPRGAVLPVFVTDEARIGIGRGRRSTARVIEWMRASEHRVALVTNGRQWRLVHAGPDHDAWAEWETDLWFEEGRPGPQVDALRILISPLALVPPSDGGSPPLIAAIDDSRKGEAELSDALGERVRQAVEVLVHACGPRLDLADPPVPPRDIYRAATRMVMRMVVVLFAEARDDLLPREAGVYETSYSLAGLRGSLAREAAGGARDRLGHRYQAWPRVLALTKLLYEGCWHGELAIPRYGGGLFAPGDPGASDPVSRALAVFEDPEEGPTDEGVHHVLDLLCRSRMPVRQGRGVVWVSTPVDFSNLSSEYIGILYEGLLDFELRRAAAGEPVVFLALGDEPALPLSRLEAMKDGELAALVAKLRVKAERTPPGEGEDSPEEGGGGADVAGDGPPEAEVATPDLPHDVADDPEAVEPLADDAGDRSRAWDRALAWARRAVEAAGIVRRPARAGNEEAARVREAVDTEARRLVKKLVPPGDWYLVRWGGTRKGAGTFYTRPQLAGPTVRRALHPLVYVEVPPSRDGAAEAAPEWAPRTPREILAVKVCDPAMGSGSFLVAALRFLTDALFHAYHHHGLLRAVAAGHRIVLPDGKEESGSLSEQAVPAPPDADDSERLLRARLKRAVVERCLYGVDIDPLAVELARLALWVETLDRTLPFEFLDHKLKAGNSLVGTWFDRFSHYPVLAFERKGGDDAHAQGVHFDEGVRTARLKAFRNGDLKADLRRWHDAVKGQAAMFDPWTELDPEGTHRLLADGFERLHRLQAEHPADPEERARFYETEIAGSAVVKALRRAFDTWCALWFWPADDLAAAPRPTTLRALPADAIPVVTRLAAEFRFFHWELEFPDVFDREGSGFSAVVGNPPWDAQKPNSMEFFSNLDPLYRTYGKQEAVKRQREYFQRSASDEGHWVDYTARFNALTNWVANAAAPFGDPEDGVSFAPHRGKGSSRQNADYLARARARRAAHRGFADATHPFRYQGSADINTYKLFLEQTHALLRPGGRLGMLVPSGIYTDKGTGALRERFLDHCRWTHLYVCQNERFVFGGIDHRFKVAVLHVEKGGKTESLATRFRVGPGDSPEITEVETDLLGEAKYLRLEVDDIVRFSPGSRAILEVRHARDLEVLEKLYRNGVLLGERGEGGWGIRYATEFHMTNDSALFPPRPAWEAKGYRPDEYGRWIGPEGAVAVPLYQGIMVQQFDFSPKAWVSGTGLKAVWEPIPWSDKVIRPQYLMSLEEALRNPRVYLGAKPVARRVARSTDTRTTICTLVPGMPCGDKAAVLLPTDEQAPHRNRCHALPAMLNSFVFDFLARLRSGGTQLDYHFLAEVPLVSPNQGPDIDALAFLTCRINGGSPCFAPAWLEFRGHDGLDPTRPWRSLWALTPHERLRLRCLVDAIVAELYGLDEADLAWILRDCDHEAAWLADHTNSRKLDPKGFWRVDRDQDPELRHPVLTLAAFRDLKACLAAHGGDRARAIEAFATGDDGDGWKLPDTLRLADYGLGHDPRARVPQPVAPRLGPRWFPFQWEQSAEESWEECERHARALGGGVERGRDTVPSGAAPASEGDPAVPEPREGRRASPTSERGAPRQAALFPARQGELFGASQDADDRGAGRDRKR